VADLCFPKTRGRWKRQAAATGCCISLWCHTRRQVNQVFPLSCSPPSHACSLPPPTYARFSHTVFPLTYACLSVRLPPCMLTVMYGPWGMCVLITLQGYLAHKKTPPRLDLSILQPFNLSIHQSRNLSIFQCLNLSISQSFNLSISQSFNLSIVQPLSL